MVVLGIDPGYAITGVAVIEEKKDQIMPLFYGAITTEKMEFTKRIKLISDKLIDIIKQYKPEEAGIEKLFFNKNSKTAISVAELRGAVLLTLINYNIKVFNYTPLQVKKSVVGYGGADKIQIQQTIKLLFNLREIPKPDDVADAMAIALCHINSSKFNRLVKEAV